MLHCVGSAPYKVGGKITGTAMYCYLITQRAIICLKIPQITMSNVSAPKMNTDLYITDPNLAYPWGYKHFHYSVITCYNINRVSQCVYERATNAQITEIQHNRCLLTNDISYPIKASILSDSFLLPSSARSAQSNIECPV